MNGQRWDDNTLGRREVLFRAAGGFGGVALAALLTSCQRMSSAPRAEPPTADVAKKAKRVIYLYMEGGPSQIDTFDPKPELERLAGKPIGSPTHLALPPILAERTILPSPFRFRRFGSSGIEVSELFPHLAEYVDDMSVIRSMQGKYSEHATANCFMNTGWGRRGRPSVGSWVLYGLGSTNDQLPGFVVLGQDEPLKGGNGSLAHGFLPPMADPLTVPVEYDEPYDDPLRSEIPLSLVAPNDSWSRRSGKLAAIHELNQAGAELRQAEAAVGEAISQLEVAAQMQLTLPDAWDLNGESRATLKLYGVDDKRTLQFATLCIRARRMLERGVRFVQLCSPEPPASHRFDNWDQHSHLIEGHRANALQVDKPIAGLFKDLKLRGLWEDTLIVWGGEFGRTPTQEIAVSRAGGRDHNPRGFTVWLAGGPVRGGTVHGSTDEFGYAAVEGVVTVHDLHATILHLIGIDHEKLAFRHGGRDFRLTDVYGDVVHDVVA